MTAVVEAALVRAVAGCVLALGCQAPNPAFAPPRDGPVAPAADTGAPAGARDGSVASSLVGWWTFDEPSGLLVHDRTANRLDGQVAGAPGATRVAGRSGQALRFDGNIYVTVPTSPALDGVATGCTLAAWIRIPQVTQAVIAVASRQVQTTHEEYYGLFVEFGRASAYGNMSGLPKFAAVPVGTWTHVAAAYDGRAIVAYLDGQPVRSTPAAFQFAGDTTPFVIGGNSDDATGRGEVSFRFVGDVDDVALFRRALGGDEIGRLAQGTPPGDL